MAPRRTQWRSGRSASNLVEDGKPPEILHQREPILPVVPVMLQVEPGRQQRLVEIAQHQVGLIGVGEALAQRGDEEGR